MPRRPINSATPAPQPRRRSVPFQLPSGTGIEVVNPRHLSGENFHLPQITQAEPHHDGIVIGPSPSNELIITLNHPTPVCQIELTGVLHDVNIASKRPDGRTTLLALGVEHEGRWISEVFDPQEIVQLTISANERSRITHTQLFKAVPPGWSVSDFPNTDSNTDILPPDSTGPATTTEQIQRDLDALSMRGGGTYVLLPGIIRGNLNIPGNVTISGQPAVNESVIFNPVPDEDQPTEEDDEVERILATQTVMPDEVRTIIIAPAEVARRRFSNTNLASVLGAEGPEIRYICPSRARLPAHVRINLRMPLLISRIALKGSFSGVAVKVMDASDHITTVLAETSSTSANGVDTGNFTPIMAKKVIIILNASATIRSIMIMKTIEVNSFADNIRRRIVSEASSEALFVDRVSNNVYRREYHTIEFASVQINTPNTMSLVAEYTVPTGIEFYFGPEHQPLIVAAVTPGTPDGWERRMKIRISVGDAFQRVIRGHIFEGKYADYIKPQCPEDNHNRPTPIRAQSGDLIAVYITSPDIIDPDETRFRLQTFRLIQQR